MSVYDNLPPEEVVYVTSQKIARELKHSEPEQKIPLDLKKISGIKKAAPELQKYIEDIDSNNTETDDIVIGGSSATFTQVKKFRVPKDLDISTPYLDKEVKNITAILRQKYGVSNVVVSPKFRTEMDGRDVDVVQIKIKDSRGNLVDAADIKHEVDTGMGFGIIYVNKHPKLRIGRLYVEPIGYLIHRKASAIEKSYVRKIKEGKPIRSRARKDIEDFKKMAKSIPDFSRKNLHIEMNAFEQSLTNYDKIPTKDPAETLGSQAGLGLVGESAPLGIADFFALQNKSKKKNPLNTQGFKLW